MGSFFVDLLSFEHTTAVYDIDPKRLRFMYNTERFTTLEEIAEFKPELVINAVTLKYTLDVFKQVMPYLPSDCILSQDGVARVLRAVWPALCFHPPHVRSDVCQPRRPVERECHHHHGGRLYGPHFLQGPLQPLGASHL